MHIGTIIVYIGSSTVPAIGSFGWQYNASNRVIFRRQISAESYYRVSSQGILVTAVIGFVAAADTSNSSFYRLPI
jgi:hypothetical protein